MKTWIFQGNPNTFDIEGYLQASTGTITWAVKRYMADIYPGDSVYLWQSQAGERGRGGIIAHATVLERSRLQKDDNLSRRFWLDTTNPEQAMRVRLRLDRVANRKEMLKREWLKDDSILQSLLILRLSTGTNFPVTDEQAQRLKQLWGKIGSDWQRDEIIAALILYEDLLNKPISKLANSPVERLSQKIGRVPTGVYNKLMNFRSLDPRLSQLGLKGASTSDRQIWAEFFDFDRNTLNIEAISKEYTRLWARIDRAEQAFTLVSPEEIRLTTKTIDSLMDDYRARPKNTLPSRTTHTTLSFCRDPLVVALRKKLSGFRCEINRCQGPTFQTEGGELFVEVHHLVQLSNGGADILGNTAALCACHHRMLHYGKERQALLSELLKLRLEDGTANL